MEPRNNHFVQQPFVFFANSSIITQVPTVPVIIDTFEDFAKKKRLLEDDGCSFKKRKFTTDVQEPKKEPSEESVHASLLKRRSLIARELLNSEESYCKGLTVLCELFMKPLSSLVGTLISQDQYLAIFPSQLIETILTLSRNLLEELNSRILNWDDTKVVGDVFERVASFFSNFYREYVNNYPRAIEVFQHLMKDHSFDLFIKDAQSKPICNNLDFCAYYITPIQRLPRIKLMLDDMLRNTPPNHPDYNFLNVAVSRISLANQMINEDPQKKNMSRLRVVQIQDALGVTLSTHLVQPHRHLVYEGSVLLRKINFVNAPPTIFKPVDIEPEKKPHLMAIHLDEEDPQNAGDPCEMFLFNDMVVIGKHNNEISFPRASLFASDQQTPSLSLYAKIPLESLWCVQHETQNTQFVLLSPGYRHVFAVPNSEIKNKWLSILENTCNTYFTAKPQLLESRKKYSLYKNEQLWAVTAPQYCVRISATEYNQQRKNHTDAALMELAAIMSSNEKKRPSSMILSPFSDSGKGSLKGAFKHKKLQRYSTESALFPPGSPQQFNFGTQTQTQTTPTTPSSMPMPQQNVFNNTNIVFPFTPVNNINENNSPVKTPTKSKILARILPKTLSGSGKTPFPFSNNNANSEFEPQSIFPHFRGFEFGKDGKENSFRSAPRTPEKN